MVTFFFFFFDDDAMAGAAGPSVFYNPAVGTVVSESMMT